MASAGARWRGGLVWLLVVGLAVLGAVGGYTGGVVRSPEFASEAVFVWDPSGARFVDPSAFVPDATSLEGQAAVQALRASSDAVLESVSDSTGVDVEDLRELLTVSAASNVVTIRVEADSAETAQGLAQAVLDSYLESVTADFAQGYTRLGDALQGQIDTLNVSLLTIPVGDPFADNIASQIAVATSQQALARAKAAAPVTPVDVLSEASLPLRPASASAVTLAVVGGALGGMIGIALALLLRFMRARARSENR